MVIVDPTMDIAQQTLPPFDKDAALQDFGVTSLVEFAPHKNKGLGATCEPSGLYPLCELVYGDKQVCIALGCPLERSNQIEPLDHEWPRDGDHLECLG